METAGGEQHARGDDRCDEDESHGDEEDERVNEEIKEEGDGDDDDVGEDSGEEGYSSVIRPSLLHLLRAVLDQYPDDGQILKEVIQNALDAGASTVKVVHDRRCLSPDPEPPSPSPLSPHRLPLQGPALCVFNDQLFRQSDWRAVRMIHDSFKKDDSLKVGRFGLGFKSVFHMTDHVCIVSGKRVLFLDPLQKDEAKECFLQRLSALSPHARAACLRTMGGLFGFGEDCLSAGHFQGTLLWFPLRQTASPLSSKVYSHSQVENLMENFRVEAPGLLLFLRQLSTVELYVRGGQAEGDTPDQLRLTFTVSLSEDGRQAVLGERARFSRETRSLRGSLPSRPLVSVTRPKVQVTLMDGGGSRPPQRTHSWLVVDWHGGTRGMSTDLSSLCRDRDLGYRPIMGAAFPLDTSGQFSGQIFCFLPLPPQSESPTGLPVHVNGSFALSQNRAHVKWPNADQREKAAMDQALRWNCGLVTEVLPPLYATLVAELASQCSDPDLVYTAVPDPSRVRAEWRPLLPELFRLLRDVKWAYTSSGNWVKPSEAVLVSSDSLDPETEMAILNAYTQIGRHVVQASGHVAQALRMSGCQEEATPRHLADEIRKRALPEDFPPSHKVLILAFLLSSQDPGILHQLNLLPTQDGGFQAFVLRDVRSGDDVLPSTSGVTSSSSSDVILGPSGDVTGASVLLSVETDLGNLLPGLERGVVSCSLPPDLLRSLHDLALSEHFQLKLLSKSNFPSVLQRCVKNMNTERVSLEWVNLLWSWIHKWFPQDMNAFRGMRILPEMTSKDTCRLHDLGDPVMCEQGQGERLPECVASALRILGLKIMSSVPESLPQRTFSEFLRLPAPNGAAEALGGLPAALHQRAALAFNERATAEEKAELTAFMKAATLLKSWPGASTLLRKLQIFKDTCGDDASLDEVTHLSPEEGLPQVRLPSRLIQLHPDTIDLAHKLGASHKSSRAVIEELLGVLQDPNQTRYSEEESEKILVFVLTRHGNDRGIMEKAGEARLFQIAGDHRRLRAKDVFDPQDNSLRRLFENEDKFPANNLAMDSSLHSQLLTLGLKGPSQVTRSDIEATAHKVQEMYHSLDREKAVRKAEALVDFVQDHALLFQSSRFPAIRDVVCWPVQDWRPRGYPRSLVFLGETSDQRLARLSEAVHTRHWSVAGSSALVTKADISDGVAQGLGWSKEPDPAVVVRHLRNLVESYQPNEAADFAVLRSSVYDLLSRNLYSLGSHVVAELMGFQSVWTDDNCGFQAPGSVWLTRDGSDVKLEPYRFALSEPMKKWRPLFQRLGAAERQNAHMLTAVLKDIQDKHEPGRVPPTEVDRDLRLCLDVLEALRGRHDLDDVRHELLVPVHSPLSDRLVLKPVSMCTVCDEEWLKDLTDTEEGNENDDDDEVEEIYYVHERVRRQTAEELGVPLLTDRVLTDTRDLDTDFGLKEELTTLLHNLLREYKDGFSVPKELVQNADDAGASCVRFMYDQRENRDARTCLIDPAMADTQGEALWVFNDALFSEADLDNIQKYNGATKESDAATIGKFGLGFCSVYNLTDVPQFVSGKAIVFFDPRQRYLKGKKGLRVDIGAQKNQAMLRKFRNQLKPFDGVFGCSVAGLTRGSGYDGTLFRFPLRQPQQAANNEIKDLHYSESEMKEFLRRLVEGLGNLLLFTQSVTTVEVHHLPRSARGAQDARLLYRAEKKNSVRHLLRAVSRNVQTEVKEQDLATVKVTSTPEGNSFLGVRGEDSESAWRISWSSHRLPSESRVKGAVSLAAVAVPLSSSDETTAGVVPLDRSLFGFYREGHVFCFLPLPETTSLPVHVNGAFAVNSSREHLVSLSGENTSNAEGRWNKHLLETSVTDAYLRLLIGLERSRSLDTEDYYALWPREATSPTERILVHSFYMAVSRGGDARVFRQGDSWAAMDGARFLDPEIRGGTVGEIALEALQKFWPGSDVIVDLPDHVIKNLLSSSLSSAFKARWVGHRQLFEEVVLPNISTAWWTDESRGRILLYALEGRDPSVLDHLRTTACVATQSHGLLRPPPQLVHPEGAVTGLFLPDEERFPAAFTSDKGVHLTFLDRLTEIGMAKDELPWEQVVERARTVPTLALQGPEAALKRSRAIVQYLTKTILVNSNRLPRYKACPEHYREELSMIEWLPVLKKPADWPCQWTADSRSNLFAAPSELYTRNCKDLTGCLFLIHDQDRSERLDHSQTLAWLGVKGKKEVTLQDVVGQLNAVASQVNSNEAGVSSPESVQLLSICRDIYSFFKQYMTSSSEAGVAQSREEEVREMLRGKNVVHHAGKFLPPEKVCFLSKYDLEPYLYVLEHNWKAGFRDVFRAIGVGENHVVSEVDQAMESIRASRDGTVQGATLDKYCLMASLLADLVEPSQEGDTNHRYLPDASGKLELINHLCWNDWEDLLHVSSLKHVHSKISHDVARKLGVRSNRAQHAQSFAAAFTCAFGQKEDLTDRIRNILKGYPRDSTVMKEFLQNADDAGATELVFLKDFRSHGCEKVLCETWKHLQGPALCVYNDSSFSASDIAGIQRLGLGSKEDDPLKTGQYGVGFNAIYHLTDAPAFWTKGENLTEEGDSEVLCVLDPNMFFVPPTTPMKPGIMLRNLDQVRQSFPDIFSGFLPRYTERPGTFFRFPLRNKEFAEKSKIPEVRQEITTKIVEDLLEEMKKDMFESLMFLSNVRKISIARVEENGDVTIEYAVESTMSETDGQRHRAFMAGLAAEAHLVLRRDETRAGQTREVGLDQMDSREVAVTLTISDAPNGAQEEFRRQEKWLVLHRYGFQHRADLPESLREAWANGQIKLLPQGGVAVLRKPASSHKGLRPAFCILPLPVQTGLPVAVNGHFALSSQNRRNLWHGNDHRDEWNREVVRGIIVPAYLSALSSLRDAIFPPEGPLDTGPVDPGMQEALYTYHSLFPSLQSAEGELWKVLVQDFFQRIVAERLPLFPVVKTSLRNKGKQNQKEITSKPRHELKWVAVAADSGFPGIFQNLAQEYFLWKEDAKDEDKKRAVETSNALVTILMALGLDIVSSPMSIYIDILACLEKLSEGEEKESAVAAETVHTATPSLVIRFLKTFEDRDTQCLLKELPRPVDQTVLGDEDSMRRVVDFCAKDEGFISKLPGLPLCLSRAKEVRKFTPENPVIVTRFADLLPNSANLFLHEQILRHFDRHIGSSVTLKKFDVEIFGKYLDDSFSKERFGSGRPIEWVPQTVAGFPTKNWVRRVWNFFSDLLSEEDKARKEEEKLRKEEDKAGKEEERAAMKNEMTASNPSAPKPEEVKGKQASFKGETRSVVREQLRALENWCLLPTWIGSPSEAGKGGAAHSSFATSRRTQPGGVAPAQEGNGPNVQFFLYPIGKRHNVLFVESASALQKKLFDVLQSLRVPKLSLKHVDIMIKSAACNLASELVARVEDPESMLSLLASNDPGMTQGLEMEDGRIILGYFCERLKDLREKMNEETLRKGLRELPFFYTAERKFTSLSQERMPVCIEDCYGMYVPKLHLGECLQHHGLVSLFHLEELMDLYKFVSIKVFDPTDFYTRFLLDFFDRMPDQARLAHLEFIRVNLLTKPMGKEFSSAQEDLISKLKTVPFVSHGDGSLKTAGEFFRPGEKILELMRSNFLLPKPFCEKEWIAFTELVGVVSQVDESLFVKFAEEVAQKDADGKLEEAQSRCLLEHLWSHDELCKGVSHQIGSIRFVLPHVVKEEMKQICPQYEAGRLVAFQESVASDHCRLVWSVQTIISEKALPGHVSKDVRKALGIPEEPNTHSVVQHAEGMCRSLKTVLEETQPAEFYSVVMECMKSLYSYLMKTGRHSAGCLGSLPVIYLDDTRRIVSCEAVVLNIDDNDLIADFLYRAPTTFGEYFDVFQSMGVSKKVTPNHYAMVLEKIYERTSGGVLQENDLAKVAQAVCRLFNHLMIASTSTEESGPVLGLDCHRTLYLPNHEKKLLRSSELVFADNDQVRQRAGKLELNYFLGFDQLHLQMADHVAAMGSLPEGLRPQMLSDLLKEALTPQSRENACEGYLATRYKNFISSPEFILGVIRLLIKDGKEKKRVVTDHVAKETEHVLSSVKLEEIKDLTTHFVYQGNVLPGSDFLRPCFEEKSLDDGGGTTIYLNDVEASDDARNVLLCQAVNRILPSRVRDPVFLLLFSYMEHPGDIDRLLNELSFPPSNYSCARPSSAHPDPGTFVPADCHWTLEDGFQRLPPGACVGHEVYDGIVSGDAVKTAAFVYVFVKRCDESTGDLPFQAMYLVEVGEGREVVVPASALYKLTRDKAPASSYLVPSGARAAEPPEPADLHGTKRYLAAAWASPDPTERKRVIKRLYMLWHPDKNTESPRRLCDEIASKIRRYVHRLSRGGVVASDDDDSDDNIDVWERPEEEDDWGAFFRDLDERVRKQQEAREAWRDPNSLPLQPNPQPREGSRYLRQAKRDLAMAERALASSIDSNWVCFLGQQAAEKALKAALYIKDANLASYSHDLVGLSSEVGKSDVSSWASQLESVIGHFNCLRYPDSSRGNTIPAEIYSENNAARTNELARKIVDKVAEQLP